MKTVYNSLTFYDKIEKQERNRFNQTIPIHSPRHQLPPFIIMANGDTITGVDTVELVGTTTVDISAYFSALPSIYTDAALGKYIEYKGAALLTPLPYGEWYLKISVDGYVYYSDYFIVSDIYTGVAGSWANSSYETFLSAGPKILSAIETGTSGVCLSGTFNVKNGETIKVIFTLNLNSGQAPAVHLANSGWTISDSEASAAGINVLSLTSTWEGPAAIILSNTAAANWSTSEILVIRDYSLSFCKLKFYNAANLGELCYADSFYQEVWLEAILNHTSHETVQVGEEKDGIFIPEKITTKLNYSIVAYICHALYLALVRLPQHSSITITDEVGNIYSPQPGNISIDQPEWVDYNTAKTVIRFNNDTTSNFSWVK